MKKLKTNKNKYPKPPSMKWVYLGLLIGFIGAAIALFTFYSVYELAHIGNQISGRSQ